MTNYFAGALVAGGGAFFYNYGLWNAQADLALLNSGGAPGTVFNNFGTFRKLAGSNAGQTQIGNPVAFNNTGIVDVQTGNLVLQGIGNFTAGYITTNSTGTTYFSSGSFNLNGTTTGTNVIEKYGDLIGTNVINSALTWQDGSWASTVVTVNSNSVLNINGTVNYAIGGCILTNFGTLNWPAVPCWPVAARCFTTTVCGTRKTTASCGHITAASQLSPTSSTTSAPSANRQEPATRPLPLESTFSTSAK
jgi:hypothetical protein